MILNRKSPDIFADVAEFTELAQPDLLVKPNELPYSIAVALAIKLIEEECNEEYIPALKKYKEAKTRENLLNVIDGAMDCIYVIAWAMRVLNVPAQAMWNEVQKSNMDKFIKVTTSNGQYAEAIDAGAVGPIDYAPDTPDKCLFEEIEFKGHKYWVFRNRETNKVMKPRSWNPPNLHKVLEEYETILKMRSMPDGIAAQFMKEYFHEMESRRDRGEIIDR